MSATRDLVRPAIILAAGEGRRIGGPKVLIDLNGETVLQRVTRICREGGFNPLTAVGPTALREQIRARVQGLDSVLDNPAPETGPLRSLQIGLDTLPADAPGTLMVLVDFCLVGVATHRALGEAAASNPSRLWRPVFQGRHGHPVWFPASLFQDLREAPLSEGARTVVYAHRDLWGAVDVDDPWIHRDLDSPEDLEAFREEVARSP